MNRDEYGKILKNVMNILKNPNGNFGKRFLSGEETQNAETGGDDRRRGADRGGRVLRIPDESCLRGRRFR